jgi:hypothetical protein
MPSFTSDIIFSLLISHATSQKSQGGIAGRLSLPGIVYGPAMILSNINTAGDNVKRAPPGEELFKIIFSLANGRFFVILL